MSVSGPGQNALASASNMSRPCPSTSTRPKACSSDCHDMKKERMREGDVMLDRNMSCSHLD